jgi:YVTN family beta-propeller protein
MKPTLLILLLSAAAVLVSQPAPREQVGPLPSGGFLLNSGWRIRPVGNQVAVGTMPMTTALSPDGKYLLVLNGGYNPPSISVIDIAAEREIGRIPVADGWLGLTFSPKGDFVYVGGGSQASVFEFKYSNGALTPGRTFPLVPEARRTPQDFIGDVAMSPDGRLLYAADLFHDSVAVINPQSGLVIEHFKTGRRPYRILFHPDGKSFFVTSWADGSLGHYETASGALLATVRLAPHPTDMVWRPPGAAEEADGEAPIAARLFVAAANTNNVYSVGVTAAKELRVLESINVAMTPPSPPWHDAERAGAESGFEAALRGLFRRQCGGRGGHLSRSRPGTRIHSYRLVSHSRARARQWQAGHSERPRIEVVPEPGRTQPNQEGRTPGQWHGRRAICRQDPDGHGRLPFRPHRRTARNVHKYSSCELAVRRHQTRQRRSSTGRSDSHPAG